MLASSSSIYLAFRYCTEIKRLVTPYTYALSIRSPTFNFSDIFDGVVVPFFFKGNVVVVLATAPTTLVLY
jgi:hypothetical protein